MISKGVLEIEIKIAIADLSALLARIRGLGLRLVARRMLEQNLVFDWPDGRLYKQDLLFRLRRTGKKTMLTLKGKSGPEKSYKVRREIEIGVTDYAQAQAMFKELGLCVFFEYEKYRRIFTGRAAHLMVDETPIGNFLEIEGSRRAIDWMAASLGFSGQDYITATYFELFNRHHSGPMIFSK